MAEQKRKTLWQVGAGVPTEVKNGQDGQKPTLSEFLKEKGIDPKVHKVRVFKDKQPVHDEDYEKPMQDGNYALATAPKAGAR